MAINTKFGGRLKQLRHKAGLTLRQLAAPANIDYSYLSKIENGNLPPPSARVIIRLAQILGEDKDDLFTLAGKIPPDINDLLRNRETIQRLRAEKAEKEAKK